MVGAEDGVFSRWIKLGMGCWMDGLSLEWYESGGKRLVNGRNRRKWVILRTDFRSVNACDAIVFRVFIFLNGVLFLVIKFLVWII